MDTKKLRQKILDLAIRGKLVPQDPTDEPASVLLQRIRAEKERLIAEGKIKRPKKSKTPSSESNYQQFEPPFEIPESWEWVSMKEIFLSMEKRVPCDKNFSYIDIDSIDNKRNIVIPKTVDAKSAPSRASRRADKGDIVFSLVRPYLRNIALVPKNNCIASTGLYVFTPSAAIDSSFAFRLLLSEYVVNGLNSFMKGDNSPSINVKNVEEFMVALPPLSEQKRIANKIETVFQLLTIIEDEKEGTIKNISKAKSKILEFAMQGKLVPQDPTDESAAEMLKRIKPKAKIITDNPHLWNLPSNWIWISVKDVFKPMERKLPSGDKFLYIDIDSIDNKSNTVTPKVISIKTAPSRASRKTIKGDIVFSMVRPYLKNIAIVPEDDCIASTGFYVLSCTDSIDPQFAFLIAISDFFVQGLNSFMKGDNSPSINKDNVGNYVIPLPSMNEQKRIVAKIEEIFSCLDAIEASL